MVSPEKLANRTESLIRHCVGRVGPESIGAEQYYDEQTDTQKFETMSVDELLQYYQEEAMDMINYGVMFYIRLDAARTVIAERLSQGKISLEDLKL